MTLMQSSDTRHYQRQTMAVFGMWLDGCWTGPEDRPTDKVHLALGEQGEEETSRANCTQAPDPAAVALPDPETCDWAAVVRRPRLAWVDGEQRYVEDDECEEVIIPLCDRGRARSVVPARHMGGPTSTPRRSASRQHERLGPVPVQWQRRIRQAQLRCGRPRSDGQPCRTPVARAGHSCANHRMAT